MKKMANVGRTLIGILVFLFIVAGPSAGVAGQSDEAIAGYKAIVKQTPDSVKAQCDLADAYIEKYISTGKASNSLMFRAKKAISKAEKIDAKSALPQISWVKYFMAMDKKETAVKRAQKAYALDPENSEAKKLAAEFGLKVKKKRAAAKTATKAARGKIQWSKAKKAHSFAWKTQGRVDFSPDSRYIAAGHTTGQIRIWDVDRGSELKNLTGHSLTIASLVFSPDGSLLASSDERYGVKLWNTETWQVSATLSETKIYGARAGFNALAFSPDGLFIAGGGNTETINIWNTQTGMVQASLPRLHDDQIEGLSYNRDGTLLISSGTDDIILRNPESNKVVSTFKDHLGPVKHVYHPRIDLIASAAWDGVKLRNSSGKLLKFPKKKVNSPLAFSPDGKVLAGASKKGVTIMDMKTGKPIHILQCKSPSYLVFSPDGWHLATAEYTGNIIIWKLP